MERTPRTSSATPLPVSMRRDLVSQYKQNTHIVYTDHGTDAVGILNFISHLMDVLICVQGVIHEDHLRELLTTMGDRFTDEEVDELFREAPIDKKGNFNYAEFTRILKHGAKDKDDE